MRVRETLPDRVIDDAELEIVDIPPDELIERLREGKVYVPQEASRALGHFFSKSNLSALRELALRRAAQAVDAQMLDYMRANAVAGTWAVNDRLVVAISEQRGAPELVRRLDQVGVRVLPFGPRRIRLVTHLDVDRNACLRAAQRFAAVMQAAPALQG